MHAGSADDTVLAQMNLGELRVRIGKLELDRLLDLGPATPDLGKRVFKPAHHVDADPMFGFCHGVEDRLAAPFGDAFDHDAAPSCRNVGLKIDLRKDRRMHLFKCGSKNAENRCAGLGVLAGEDAEQRSALELGRPLIYHHGGFALSFVNGSRPAEDADKLQAIELGLSVLASLDLHARHRLTIAMGGQTVELTRTAVGAIAVDELAPMNRPVRVSHISLLTDRDFTAGSDPTLAKIRSAQKRCPGTVDSRLPRRGGLHNPLW